MVKRIVFKYKITMTRLNMLNKLRGNQPLGLFIEDVVNDYVDQQILEQEALDGCEYGSNRDTE